MANGFPVMFYATNGQVGVTLTRTSTARQLRDTSDVQPTPIESADFEAVIQKTSSAELAITLAESFEAAI